MWIVQEILNFFHNHKCGKYDADASAGEGASAGESANANTTTNCEKTIHSGCVMCTMWLFTYVGNSDNYLTCVNCDTVLLIENGGEMTEMTFGLGDFYD